MKRKYGDYEVTYESEWVTIVDVATGRFTRTTRATWEKNQKYYGARWACGKIMSLDIRRREVEA